MEQMISKQQFDELMNLKGETRGIGFKTEAKFILEDKGEEGVKKLEKTMAELGFAYDKINEMEFYPLGWLGVALVVIKNLFGYDDKKFQEMGKFEAKASLLIRLFMKYFCSLDMVAKQSPNMWRKYYTVGDLSVAELNKEKKYIVIKIDNFKLHPILCQVLMGYYLSIVKMIVKSEITCEERKCVHKGDEFHEFLIRWGFDG